MQSLIPTSCGSYYCSIREVWSHMVKQEGMLRPMRGMGAVVVGAGPAHALYFSSFEYLRDKITHQTGLNSTISSGKGKFSVWSTFNNYNLSGFFPSRLSQVLRVVFQRYYTMVLWLLPTVSSYYYFYYSSARILSGNSNRAVPSSSRCNSGM